MRTFLTFFLGLISGWLLKWLVERVGVPRERTETVYRFESPASALDFAEPAVAAQVPPDDLKIIKGIGPVIERKLNEAGILTFKQLGGLTSDDLRGILGRSINRLADEDSLLKQARRLTRGG